jgi:SAM-dependent methyltransferase
MLVASSAVTSNSGGQYDTPSLTEAFDVSGITGAPMKASIRRFVGWLRRNDDPFGLGLQPGDPHPRAYVGPPQDYDLIGGIQFSLLLAAGLRETHRVVDVGCGSLRAGRLLIPYLRPGHYYGLDPNRWLIEEGIRREVGRDLVRIKRPRFDYADDFSLAAFGTTFDYAMAQSIFSHAYADLTLRGLKEIAKGLADSGLLLATYIDGDTTTPGSGWLYPGCVTYTWDDMLGLIDASGLVARRLDWMHPRQTWFAAARAGDEQRLTDLADRLRPPLADK